MNLNECFDKNIPLGKGIRKFFFEHLNTKLQTPTDRPIPPATIFKEMADKDLSDIKNVFFAGKLSDITFQEDGDNSSFEDAEKEVASGKYDSILVFGIEMNSENPTRSRLSEITRWLNRKSCGAPVSVVFSYAQESNFSIAFANSERTQFQQQWREGEKVGKVSILRDIDVQNPHRGHIEILEDLKIPTTGKSAVNSFETLYKYWQDVFNVSILNKKFYKELQSWYFWAIKEVYFPTPPSRFDFESDDKFDEAVKEHKGKNVIRLLTRILFIWFIKEKKLIPEELFDEKSIAGKLIHNFTPQKPKGIFATGKHTSQYYRAILQNLFFATLNQEMGKRAFRIEGANQNVTNLMRYKSYFKNSDYFVKLMEEVVPFMNGGLFECLDKPHPTTKGRQGGDIIIYNDGFSDRDDNLLEVPDYLFFDVEEEVDLSDNFDDNKDKKVYKNTKTRGLLEILKSYKFTIAENTPLEEDVALDPELLGKVFENLLASYNPETKTTARKQTGSFYTPREIVNYMVDESLIAYLKNSLSEPNTNEEQLAKDLHQLLSYNNINPFQDKTHEKLKLIRAIDQCSILDPACGSGAFPMGILQKMVHILHKIDPSNTEWKRRQLDRVDKAIESLEEIDDAQFREQSIKELEAQKTDIEESFANNELDYGRKLYLIENCIYGIDIQPIATQISKLRFFISLIVDQKIDKTKPNFGIRPLPNLETKFVSANSLIGIEKPKEQLNLFENLEIKKLEAELKKVRHRLFSAKTPAFKRKLREEDKALRSQIAELLVLDGWQNETARQLASWDPYDQNEYSPFFDSEWMFDKANGFDIVIGNPPFHQLSKDESASNEYKIYLKNRFGTSGGRLNTFIFFTHLGIKLLSIKGVISFIIPNTILTQDYYKETRKHLLEETTLFQIVSYDRLPFENAVVENVTFFAIKQIQPNYIIRHYKDNLEAIIFDAQKFKNEFYESETYSFNFKSNTLTEKILKSTIPLVNICNINQAIALKGDKTLSLKRNDEEGKYFKLLDGKNINKYNIAWGGVYLDYDIDRIHSCKRKDIFTSKEKLFFRRVSSTLIFCYDDEQYFALNTLVVVNLTNTKDYYLKFLLGILNSKLMDYYYCNKHKSTKKVFSEIQARSVGQLPIKQTHLKVQEKIVLYVDQILSAHSQSAKADTVEQEQQIDNMVYKMYGLNYDEVKVIDPMFDLSEAEYDALVVE